jgi:peptide deformylase
VTVPQGLLDGPDDGLLTVRTFGDPILREVARMVTAFDDDLRVLARSMIRTIDALGANGIAGNQVGVLQRVFAWRADAASQGACVNPRILDTSAETAFEEEGCVSFPRSFRFEVERSLRAEVAFQDVHGDEHRTTVEGRLARTFLHEIDHLNGILFVDHLAMHERARAERLISQGALVDIPQPLDAVRGDAR